METLNIKNKNFHLVFTCIYELKFEQVISILVEELKIEEEKTFYLNINDKDYTFYSPYITSETDESIEVKTKGITESTFIIDK